MSRNGGDLVVETLAALGADTVFGIPGQHALGLFDALGRSTISFRSSRVENNAAFTADGYARATGRPAVLFLSTGPGALTALAGLQEAAATGVPLVVVVSQVPNAGIGLRRGMLHELDEQRESARNVTKSTRLVRRASQIPSAIAESWSLALTAPAGPAWVEIPQDVLLAPTEVPLVADVAATLAPPRPRTELVQAAAQLLEDSMRPVILAGGGVLRADARGELLRVAELLRAVVVMTPGGNGAFPWDHSLSAGAWVEERATTELLADADVLLALGTSFGEVTSNYFSLRPRGRVIQVDAELAVLESNHEALAIHADAGLFLRELEPRLAARPADGRAERTARELRETVEDHLAGQGLDAERALLTAVRAAVPSDAHTFWDMTIAAYWAWSAWDARDGGFHSAQGAGGLGFAYPAAIGAALGTGRRTLAVSGDGGAMYSLAELATARQHDAPVSWLVIDDGGYGILREYMVSAFGAATATELARPDFVALAESFGVPAVTVGLDGLQEALEDSWAVDGPRVVVLRARLAMFQPAPPEVR